MISVRTLALAAVGGAVLAGPPAAVSSASGPFSWLAPSAAPAGWGAVALRPGVVLSYPPGWRREKTDPGTATRALLGPRGAIDGYLNITPRQANEKQSTWARFRVSHNVQEGERDLRTVASAQGLRFRNRGRGACVIDRYRTTSAHYQEIACLVHGAVADTVIVAAAPLAQWHARAATLERAVSAFTT